MHAWGDMRTYLEAGLMEIKSLMRAARRGAAAVERGSLGVDVAGWRHAAPEALSKGWLTEVKGGSPVAQYVTTGQAARSPMTAFRSVERRFELPVVMD